MESKNLAIEELLVKLEVARVSVGDRLAQKERAREKASRNHSGSQISRRLASNGVSRSVAASQFVNVGETDEDLIHRKKKSPVARSIQGTTPNQVIQWPLQGDLNTRFFHKGESRNITELSQDMFSVIEAIKVDASEAELLETGGAPIEQLPSDGEDGDTEISIRVKEEWGRLDQTVIHTSESFLFILIFIPF
ncbi:C2H2-like zinc finger protein [Striga asiatica]|uniref:C2H2-like zinc finger protein n=1 Tax=Striga asiatica TaxID=4170 RepID=A0A5A7PZ98_STRAF|nr:C2H2-like zinc finger protein [Striga asiatica]